ncbi:hypothetical protein [Epilithonimonas sp.]|jgi:hypothetical protein|uniref:hypothetical protein n=1 Tax=Epilithonimonas sp. TaxID=2894511 RepID=UPI0035AE2EAA
MQISINLPFEELLAIIKKLNPKEKEEVAKLLLDETEVSEEQLKTAVSRKQDFENGNIDTESWKDLKKRLLN